MNSFVKFSPSVETFDPDFEKNLATIISGAEAYVSASATVESNGRAVRDAHAQGYGLVRAEFEILPGLPAPYAQGIYATPGKHDAVIRFSNGSPHAGADLGLGSATGIAVKIFDVPGKTLLDDEPDLRLSIMRTSMRRFSSATPSNIIFSSRACSSTHPNMLLRASPVSIVSCVNS